MVQCWISVVADWFYSGMSGYAVHVVDYHDGDCDHNDDLGFLFVDHLLLTLEAEKVDGHDDGDGDGDQHPDHRLHRYRESVILAAQDF